MNTQKHPLQHNLDTNAEVLKGVAKSLRDIAREYPILTKRLGTENAASVSDSVSMDLQRTSRTVDELTKGLVEEE